MINILMNQNPGSRHPGSLWVLVTIQCSLTYFEQCSLKPALGVKMFIKSMLLIIQNAFYINVTKDLAKVLKRRV